MAEAIVSRPWNIRRHESASAESLPATAHRVGRLSRSIGAIRTIAAGRLILGTYWLLAFLLDPPETLAHPTLTYALLYGYAAYALGRALVVWHALDASRMCQIAMHAADLAVFAALTLLTQSGRGPFLVGFIFSLVCATILFEIRGMLWTAGAALLMYIFITYATRNAPDFTISRFVVRVGFLGTMAVMLVQLKKHEERLQHDYRKLAEWPRGSIVNLTSMITEVLQHARELLRVPRVLVVWDDAGAPNFHVAVATADSVTVTEEPIAAFPSVVDRAARLKSFVSTNWLRSPAARSESMAEVQAMQSNPIDAKFREHFHIDAVVASRFSGEAVSGWLFALDKVDVTEDDVVLTGIVAALVENRLEQFYLAATVRDNAVAQERTRCARDLHDGILQSLNGTALHLRSLGHLIANDSDAALFRLREIEEALASDQREVRSFIMKLRAAADGGDERALAARLAGLGERIQREWGLKVTVQSTPLIEIVAPAMAEEIYRLVQEALTNAAVHSTASRVGVEVSVRDERVHIVIADNGRGFPFTGRYDLAALTRMKRGPLTLKERVASLGGNLVIDSEAGGARIDIDVPPSIAPKAAI